MGGRIPHTESLRVPEPGSSAPGQPAPKSRPKGVDDGKRANIPVPVAACRSPGGTRKQKSRRVLDVPMQRGSLGEGETTLLQVRPDAECSDASHYQGFSMLAARKSLGGECCNRPYRKPTQVGEARSLRCSSDPWRRNSAT